jgi:hypothetical protein
MDLTRALTLGSRSPNATVVVSRFDSVAAACALGHNAHYPQVCVGAVSSRKVGRLVGCLYPSMDTTSVARIGILNMVATRSTLYAMDADGQVRYIDVELSGDRQDPDASISVDGILVGRSTPSAGLRGVESRMPAGWYAKAFALVTHVLRVMACCRPRGLALEKRSDGLKTGGVPHDLKEARRAAQKPPRSPFHFRRGCVVFGADGCFKRRNACYINCDVQAGPEGQGALYLIGDQRRARQRRRKYCVTLEPRVTLPWAMVEDTLRRLGVAVPRSPVARAATAAALLIALTAFDRGRCKGDPDAETLLAAWLRRHASHAKTRASPKLP